MRGIGRGIGRGRGRGRGKREAEKEDGVEKIERTSQWIIKISVYPMSRGQTSHNHHSVHQNDLINGSQPSLLFDLRCVHLGIFELLLDVRDGCTAVLALECPVDELRVHCRRAHNCA